MPASLPPAVSEIRGADRAPSSVEIDGRRRGGDVRGGGLGVVAGPGERAGLDVADAERLADAPSSRANCAGSTQRSTGRWCDVGRRYWPIVTMSTPIAGEVGEQRRRPRRRSRPCPTISPDFVVSPAALARASTRQAAGVAGRRAHRPLQPGDRLDVVVEHVGPDGEQQRRATAASPRASEISVSTRVAGPPVADRLDARRDVGHAAVGEVVAGDHREHGVVEAHAVDRPRRPAPARRPPAPRGLRVSTRQKPHARVQRSPSTMNVAVPSAQHSDRFGQPASSHTVTRPRSRTVRLSASTSGAVVHLRAQPLGLARLDRTDPAVDAAPQAHRRRRDVEPHRARPGPAPRENSERSSGRCRQATSWRSARPSPHRSPARRATTSTTSRIGTSTPSSRSDVTGRSAMPHATMCSRR